MCQQAVEGSETGHQLSRQDSVIFSGISQTNFRPVNPRILHASGQTHQGLYSVVDTITTSDMSPKMRPNEVN